MATVVQQPSSSDSGMGVFMAVILVILFLVLVWFFGMPLMRQGGSAPAAPANPPAVEVPGQIDVNLNQK